jgi:hypothetical protein
VRVQVRGWPRRGRHTGDAFLDGSHTEIVALACDELMHVVGRDDASVCWGHRLPLGPFRCTDLQQIVKGRVVEVA